MYDPKNGCICPGDLILNTTAGACVCPTCPGYLELQQDGDKCQCICTTQCSDLQVLEEDVCQCICKEGLIEDPYSGECVCPYNGQVYDPKNGCICPGDLILNTTAGACVCPTCPGYLELQQDGDKCPCICTTQCSDLQVLEEDVCQCICKEGLIEDPYSGECVCPYNGQVYDPKNGCICPGDLILNTTAGACVCPTCPGYLELQQDGDKCPCICTTQCSDLQVLKEDVCQCICKEGLIEDPYSGECVCPYNGQVYDPKNGCICPGDLILNTTAGACVCPTCPGYLELQQDGDKCPCICTTQCSDLQVLKEDVCQCICKEGLIEDPYSGECICPEGLEYNVYTEECGCKGDKNFNEETGQCECNTCTGGFITVEKENTCKCVCNIICGEGQILDEEICECISENKLPQNSCRCFSNQRDSHLFLKCLKYGHTQERCESYGEKNCYWTCTD